MTESKINKELLFSADEEVVSKAIEILREKGSDNDLEILAELFGKTKSEQIKKLIYQFFCDLRDQKSTDSIIKIIKTTNDKHTLKMLTSSTWESKLNYEAYFELFIDLVIQEGFEIAFEAFTLLESFEEKITESRIEELLKYVQANLPKCKSENMAFAADLENIIKGYQV